jgi:myosin heavy subunit
VAKKEYLAMMSGMANLGFSDSEQQDVVQLVAGVLNMGNISFTVPKSASSWSVISLNFARFSTACMNAQATTSPFGLALLAYFRMSTLAHFRISILAHFWMSTLAHFRMSI